MSNFIARMGYILTWGFGRPEYSLEEKFEEYYKFGLSTIIVGILAMTYLIVLIVLILKKSKEDGIMNKPNHKKYALLDDGTIEPLYYDVNDTLDWDNLRHIEHDDNGENPCLVHDRWDADGIALCVNKIIKEADTIEELEKMAKEIAN